MTTKRAAGTWALVSTATGWVCGVIAAGTSSMPETAADTRRSVYEMSPPADAVRLTVVPAREVSSDG